MATHDHCNRSPAAGFGIEGCGYIELLVGSVGEGLVGKHLLHIQRPDRQCHRCALTIGHTVEVDSTILTADPASADQRGGEADKPSVGVVLRRTGLATCRHLQSVLEARTYARAMIHHVAEHIDHLVGCQFGYDLSLLRVERSDDIALFVLDAGYVQRIDTNAMVGVGGISVHHLLDADLTRSEADRYDRVELPLNAEGAHETHELVRRIERHEVGRDPVGRLLQSPTERNGVALVLGVLVARCPAHTVAVDEPGYRGRV